MAKQDYLSFSVKKIYHKKSSPWPVLLCLPFIFFYAYILFRTTWLPFWPAAAGGVILLCIYAILVGRSPVALPDWQPFSVLWGVGLTVVYSLLYALFVLLWHFVFPAQSLAVLFTQSLSTQSQLIWVSLLLFFVIGPGLEIFWRGFFQEWAINQWGITPGWLITSILYAAVFIYSANALLVLSALLAALFFGRFYAFGKNLVPCIIAHAFWLAMLYLLATV